MKTEETVGREFDPENVERQSIDNSTAIWFWSDASNTDAIKASDYDKLLALYRAASTPEAAGRGDERLMHELWVQGSRLRNELREALVLHPENWHVPAVEQQLEWWDTIAGRYAQRFAAPLSPGNQAAVSEHQTENPRKPS